MVLIFNFEYVFFKLKKKKYYCIFCMWHFPAISRSWLLKNNSPKKILHHLLIQKELFPCSASSQQFPTFRLSKIRCSEKESCSPCSASSQQFPGFRLSNIRCSEKEIRSPCSASSQQFPAFTFPVTYTVSSN